MSELLGIRYFLDERIPSTYLGKLRREGGRRSRGAEAGWKGGAWRVNKTIEL